MTPRHFNWSEFDSKDAQRKRIPGSGERMMNRAFVSDLDLVRQLMGQSLIVTSGYRTPAYNRMPPATSAYRPCSRRRLIKPASTISPPSTRTTCSAIACGVACVRSSPSRPWLGTSTLA
ncbi:MAG: hypothetical protein H6922_03035 [Pseudomonadaceae bacterium]|nr:hypothetical protein [Pseudomonadaceae bacterium]